VTGVVIWVVALALYLAFRLWYDGWRPPLSAAEIEDFLPRLPATARANAAEVATLRAFLAHDDGREFAMLNLVRIAPEPVPHPETGDLMAAMDLLGLYTREFFRAMARRAGHPAIVARAIGGYLDSWNVEDDPGWSVVGYMRYRSRRDMLELVTDPRFANAHAFKIAATPVTLSFPTSPRILLFVSPRVWVGLVLALAAALLQLLLR
jgi:hypothetical protein